jgi:hypothetical protein
MGLNINLPYTIMNKESQVVKSHIMKLEREAQTWFPWHCTKKVCSDSMCKKRKERLFEIKMTIHALNHYLIIE